MFTISGLICNLLSSFFFGVMVSEIFLIGLFIGDLKGEPNSFMGEASESFLIGLFIGDLKVEPNSFMGEASESFLMGLFIGDLKGESGNSFMGEASESFLIGLFIGDLKGESCNSFMGEIKDDRVIVVSFIVSKFFSCGEDFCFLGVVNLGLSLVGVLKVSSTSSGGGILTGDLRVISASVVSSKSFLIDLLGYDRIL